MLIGELAKSAGISTDTVRHYERNGVISKARRAANGYRLYRSDALEQIVLVRRAIAVGFTLKELAEIFAERDKGIRRAEKSARLPPLNLLIWKIICAR